MAMPDCPAGPTIAPPIVELRAAEIPVIGAIAVHYWFAVWSGDRGDRWEVWQTAGAGGHSWGHLHVNLMGPANGVGNGPSWVERTWMGADAEPLAHAIAASPDTYPHRDRYRYWPGPNSNTYAQWILDRAGTGHRLGARGRGRGYAWLTQRRDQHHHG